MKGFGMKGMLILLLAAAVTLGAFSCGGNAPDAGDAPDAAETDAGSESKESADPGQTVGRNDNRAQVNYEEDAFDLMGIEYQSFLANLNDGMVDEFLDGESAGAYEAAYHYILRDIGTYFL